MTLQLLTVGEHPNLAFYAWRLQATKACAVTVISASLDPSAPVHWQSKQLGNSVFKPYFQAQDVSQLDPKSKYDVVLLSVSNLQSFQDACTNLAPYLHSESLIVVESSGYVSLEPFVLSAYPKQQQHKITVCSIMNEADVKKHPHSNEFVHAVLNQDQRIYLGTCTSDQKILGKLLESQSYAKFYKLLQLAQEQSSGHISLLKSNNYKEFMTYQWKLALPRIVLNPLSVIFEEPYPSNLDQQILAKPLISGLVNEIFKIIKKMECKLIKGYENEANILKNWSAHFPASKSANAVVPEFRNTNSVFYNFYHQLDIDIDLLLLQPILLGDDHGVRTPYLENLYSIVCQLLKMNTAESIFFARKTAMPTEKPHQDAKAMAKVNQDLASLRLEKDTVEAQFKERSARMHQLETTLAQRQQAQDVLVQKFEAQTHLYDTKIAELMRVQQQREDELRDLDARASQKHAALTDLESRISRAETAWTQQQQQQQPEIPVARDQTNASKAVEPAAPASQVGEPKPQSKTVDYSHMETPDLSDFADIAMYGAALNAETPKVPQGPPPPHNSVSQDGAGKAVGEISEKEKELQRREQALLERERELKAAQQNVEPYYDNQTNEQFHNVPGGYPEHPGTYSNGSHNGSYYGNGHMNGAPTFRQQQQQQHSYTGPNPQYESAGYDQRPPHGLPPNGFPQNSLPQTLRNPQRYQQNGPQFNQQMPQQMPQQQRPRVQSSQSGPPGMSMNYAGQQPNISGPPATMQNRANSMAFQQQQMQNSGSQQYSLNQAAHGVPYGASQGYASKKNNRRSAFPDQALNIDYGGRGGMPMPTANGSKNKPGIQSSPPVSQPKKTFVGSNQAPAHLRIPTQNTSSNSDSLGSHGSIIEESPKPATPDSLRDVRLEVPLTEAVAKPLGGIAPPAEDGKKKKRGLFKKH